MSAGKIVDRNLITTRIIEGKPRHNVIYSAATGKDGKIYLGLSGEMDSPGCFAQLICYDPEKDIFEDIADLAKVIGQPKDSLRHPHSKIHTAICIGSDGKVYAATHMTAPPAGEDYYHYWHVYNDPARCFEGSHLVIFDPRTKNVEDFGVIAPRCGCRWLGYNPEQEELYLTTFLTAHFIVVRLKTGEVKDMGRISQYDFMGPCFSACGYVYTTDCFGFMLKYSPKDETIEKLPLKIPNVPWRNSDGNGLMHFLPGPDRVKLYGVSMVGQRLFEFDPTAGKCGKIRDYGTLFGEDEMGKYSLDVPMGRTMAVGLDGKIYLGTKHYVSENPGAHIVSVDIESGTKKDYGFMQVEGFARIYTPVASTVGNDGNVYFASEKPGKNAPLQLIIFNPAGVDKKRHCPPGNGRIDLHAGHPDPYQYSYYYASRSQNAVFATRGAFYAQELGYLGRVPPIPRNECAVTAMATGGNGVVFGATSGKKMHLFAYLPFTRRMFPLNTFGSADSACRNMVIDSRGRVYMGTAGAGDAGEAGHLFMYDFPSHATFFAKKDDLDRGEFHSSDQPPSPALARIEDLGAPVPGEGICAMAVDHEKNVIYGLTSPGGKFFAYDIQSMKFSVKDIYGDCIANRSNISRAMVCAGGNVYFSGKYGYIVKYLQQNDAFVLTGMKIPVSPGREYLNHASALAKNDSGLVYGGTYADGYFFAFDPLEEKIVNLGKPSIESNVRALSAGRDGIIWGLCGTDDEIVHLCRYDPCNKRLDDYGMIRAKAPKTWIVHRADVMVTGADGELFIGESDAISHLIIYHPPVEKREAAANLAGTPRLSGETAEKL